MSEVNSNSRLKDMRNNLNKYYEDDKRIHRRRKKVWLLLLILAVGAGGIGYFTVPKFLGYYEAIQIYNDKVREYPCYDAYSLFQNAKINNSDEWASAISYAMGVAYYNVGEYEIAANYLLSSGREKDEMFLKAAIGAAEFNIEWVCYEDAVSWAEKAEDIAYDIGINSYDYEIEGLINQTKYELGKTLYDDGEYEAAVRYLEESDLSEASELVSDIESALIAAADSRWGYICNNGDNTALEYMCELYNEGILEQCYQIFGSEKENMEFWWSDNSDNTEAKEILYSPEEIYCNYIYSGDEAVKMKILYIYDEDSGGEYTSETMTEPYSSNWFGGSFNWTPSSGYFYAFFYNADTDEPLSASRVWIE